MPKQDVKEGREVFRAKVTGRHAITLPAVLCRQLDIATGDTVEIRLVGEQAFLRRAEDEPTPPARGLLRDYFRDWEDINRFVQEERQGWQDREAVLDRMAQPFEAPGGSSTV
jgi:bifunctional DNA-binding transcriptional regulator/antitoxin component of YhaV-PrlF toxin-antitoxin module